MNKVSTGSNSNLYIDIELFTFVYKRYTHFSKDYYINNINDNIFNKTIRLNVNTNFGDFLNNIILKITLPQVSLKKSSAITQIDITQTTNNLNNFNNYIKTILNNYRAIKIKILETNLSKTELLNFIDTLVLPANTIHNIYIEEELNITSIIKNYLNNINYSVLSNNDIQTIQYKLDNLINNIKIIHKLYYYDPYIELLKQKEINDNNTYNFSWINNIAKYLIDEVSIIINNSKIETLYCDWINIWDELTLSNNIKNGVNILSGNIDELTHYDNMIKPETDIYLQFKFWFNRNNNLFLPLLYLNHDNIYLDIKFKKLLDCIYTDSTTLNLDNEIIINNCLLISEYLFLANDEKQKIITQNFNYYNIINIVNQYKESINLHSLFNAKDKKYETTIKLIINNPVSGLYFIIKSKELTKKYKLYNNYSGITNDSINKIDNFYFIKKNSTINILNNIDIKIDNLLFKNNIDVEYYNNISQYTNHTSINNNIFFIPFSLFSENSQPSGHINLISNNILELVLEFNPEFIKFLLSEFTNDELIISIYSNEYKEFKIQNGYYLI